MRDPTHRLQEANRQVEQAQRNVMRQEELVDAKRARGEYSGFAEHALRIYEEALVSAILNRAIVNGALARLQGVKPLDLSCAPQRAYQSRRGTAGAALPDGP
jgi:hypothetical protein